MLTQNSIQTRFGGGRLMPTVKDLHPGLTHTSDQVTIQVNIAGVGIRNHLSVVEFEILASVDSGVHFTFDDSHGSFAVDLINIGWMGVQVNPQWTLAELSHRSG